MLDPKADQDTKLRCARRLWEDALEHYALSNEERARAARFFHNRDGTGQWEETDKRYLEEQGRPALTFNLTKGKIEAILGMLEDVRKKPVLSPVGTEDRFAAEVHSALLDAVRRQLNLETLEWNVAEHALVRGDGVAALDVQPDPKSPTHYRIRATRVTPSEVKWDTESIEPDRSDARYVLWDRWFTKDEFKRQYPDHADQAEVLLDSSDYAPAWEADEPVANERFLLDSMPSDDYARRLGEEYVDRKRRRIRVIHLEYLAPVRRCFMVATDGSVAREIKPELKGTYDELAKSGVLDTSQVALEEVWDEQVHWLDFVVNTVLFDAVNPLPFEGFSLTPFTCFLDDSARVTYGYMRNLFDPQREVNKAHSQGLEHLIGQGKSGYIAEKSAIMDLEQFENALATNAGVALVNDGALARVQERKPPTVPEGARARFEESITMVDRIAGMAADLERDRAGAQPEALGTVQLRYRHAQIALRKVFRNNDDFQRELARKIVEVIAHAFPDQQIADLLGDSTRYAVQDGEVIEIVPGPDGQPMPGRRAQLRDVRRARFDVALDTSTENNTLRLMEVQQLAQLASLQVPIDPEVLVSKVVTSRADREALLAFVKQSKEAAARGAEAEAQRLDAQVQAGLQQQAADLAEKRRANVAKESLEARGQTLDSAAKFAAILERASADERAMLEAQMARVEARVNQPQRGPTA